MKVSKLLSIKGAQIIDLSTERAKRRTICPYCQQPGIHVRFEQCLEAIDKKGGDKNV